MRICLNVVLLGIVKREDKHDIFKVNPKPRLGEIHTTTSKLIRTLAEVMEEKQ